ncbi:MAG: EVE domain-containing protein [Bdellovibrionota bacterium]|nr:EVE domain-containing protein [Pseudobdellovibrionaceae bacterium]|tara:strand:- start:68016 stop:68486 length:471 start_codon:yes stop_codon:yes gene_type:complete
MAKKYWLMKSEPDVFSIDDLKKVKKEPWDGVRNYQARNFMMKDMKLGDEILFYHSRTKPMGVYGLATVSKEAFPDPLQFDEKSKYFEKRATKEKPVWYCVEVAYEGHFAEPVTLEAIKAEPKLSDMAVVQKGQRLSIQPVKANEFKCVLKMAGYKK